MSSILLKRIQIDQEDISLEWDKDKGFISRIDGRISNYYGRDEKKARKLFSAKLNYLRKKTRSS
jgi:hypothetical protein